MLRMIFGLTVLGFMSGANAATGPWDIASVEVRQIHEAGVIPDYSHSDCHGTSNPNDFGAIDWGDVITIGEKLWQLVEDNRPVVNVQAAEAFVLPRGLECWADLEKWQPAQTKSYEVSYKNGFGVEVVKFRFRLQYTFGGGYAGRGQYLANVTVIPAELNVVWGYTFDAQVEVEKAVNLGTAQNPLAGLELNLKWDVKTVLKESQNSLQFFVQGDGQVKTAE